MKLPVIGITMGDPAGVGPEVVMKALARPEAYALCRPLVVGDTRQLKRANALLEANLQVRSIDRPEQASFKRGTVDCIDLPLLPEDLPYGKVSSAAGEAAFRYIERAVKLALDRSIDAI